MTFKCRCFYVPPTTCSRGTVEPLWLCEKLILRACAMCTWCRLYGISRELNPGPCRWLFRYGMDHYTKPLGPGSSETVWKLWTQVDDELLARKLQEEESAALRKKMRKPSKRPVCVVYAFQIVIVASVIHHYLNKKCLCNIVKVDCS